MAKTEAKEEEGVRTERKRRRRREGGVWRVWRRRRRERVCVMRRRGEGMDDVRRKKGRTHTGMEGERKSRVERTMEAI